MRNHLFIGAAVAALMIPAAAYAQETTAVIRGSVTANGAPVANATIDITDVNSGTKTQTATDGSGNFTQSGLRGGGPFTVQVTSASGNTTITDIYTVVGQPYDLPIDLAPAATAGTTSDIIVTASSIRGAGVTSDGPQTVIGRVDISKIASVNRDIRDIERRDPFATLDLSNSRAVSFAGVNPRFNRFTINGVQIGDNFGLNSDANPTGRGPIPFDAISQVSISIAPYDIRQGNFVGGAIDTVMRSGTNKFQGTGFYSSSTDKLQGKQIGSTTITVPHYNSKTYGAELSGPIFKDHLFFMVAAERNTDPRPFTPSATSQVPGLTDATVASVVSTAKSTYNYDPGSVLSVNNQKDEKIVGKIDWNIVRGQRLSLSYINAFESADVLQNTSTSSTSPSLGLSSDAYTRSVLVKAGIVQLNSDWTDQLSTEIRGIYKWNRVNQTPMNGTGFAQFRVCTDPTTTTTPSGVANTSTATGCSSGTPVIAFGPDISRQANQLFFDTWAGSFLGRYTTGGHEFKLLVEASENRTFNLFQQYVTGSYYFDSLADFQNRSASSFDYANAVSLNTADVAANFKYTQYTFGLQDDWKVNDELTVTYGARYDLYGMRSTPALNSFYVARYGFNNNRTYKGLGNFQPRVGFNWKPTNTLKVRGGVGIFGGGSPDIYLSNSFSNTGVLANRISTVNRATTTAGTTTGSLNTATCSAPYTGANASLCGTALNGVTGNSIPSAINTYLSTATTSLATAPTNSLSQNFKLPSVWKANLSVDYKLFGFNVGADYLFSRTRQAVSFTDLRSVRNTACATCGTLPDGRTRYNFLPTPGVTGQTADTNSDYLIYNVTQGRSHIWDVRFRRDFSWGLSLSGAYAWQDVKDVSPATSSTASSLYSNAAMADPDFPVYGTSNDQVKWAFKYGIGFDHAFYGDYRTVIQLFGETRAGRPYSYTMQNNVSGRSPVFGTIGNNDRYLLYVPTSTSDSLVSYDSTDTATALDNLINSTNLSKYRGKITPKNIARNRAFTRIDLHLEQEIPTFVGKSRISLFADIENLPNLINHNWGGLRQLGFPYTSSVVQVTCLNTPVATGTAATTAQTSTISQTCAQYRYSSFKLPNTGAVSTSNSLYLIRIGARVSF